MVDFRVPFKSIIYRFFVGFLYNKNLIFFLFHFFFINMSIRVYCANKKRRKKREKEKVYSVRIKLFPKKKSRINE
jgi:hypothetical protein